VRFLLSSMILGLIDIIFSVIIRLDLFLFFQLRLDLPVISSCLCCLESHIQNGLPQSLQ
jgi:hypothetical protein